VRCESGAWNEFTNPAGSLLYDPHVCFARTLVFDVAVVSVSQGLAVSRSIGDCEADHLGVIPEPDVTIHKICPGDRFFLWCSDGGCRLGGVRITAQANLRRIFYGRPHGVHVHTPSCQHCRLGDERGAHVGASSKGAFHCIGHPNGHRRNCVFQLRNRPSMK